MMLKFVRGLVSICRGCMNTIPSRGHLSKEGIEQLMEGLIQSGFCMLDFRNASPASGAEHPVPTLGDEADPGNRPGVLHGAKVGVASIISAGSFERINQMTKHEIAGLISPAVVPNNDPTRKRSDQFLE